MPPTIRPATQDDVHAINAITNWAIEHTDAHFALTPEPLEETLAAFHAAGECSPWLVAQDDQVVGFARSKPWNPRGAYAWAVEVSAYIHPAHHARGVGTALYTDLFDRLRALGFRTVIAGITLPNAGSVRLHEKFGMTHVGTFRRVGFKNGRWHDVGYWQIEWQDQPPPLGPPS